MKIMNVKCQGGFTVGVESSKNQEFVPGTLYSCWGVALLFYRPERRLSLSVWLSSFRGIGGWSKNIRLYGPRKLSWEV